MSEPADVNVDELRRRARRRLVGAIVLALAAAVIVPMLLESDPKPLGEDVSIRIPPVDDGRFVNRLSDAAAPGGTPPSADVQPLPGKSPAEAEKAVVAPATRASRYDTALPADKAAAAPASGAAPTAGEPDAQAKAEAPANARPEAKSDMSADSRAGAKSAAPTATPAPAKSEAPPRVAARVEPKAQAVAADSTEAVRDGFAVQLAAFSDDKGANALANRLKNAGYPAYTEPFNTSRGTLWRVRVGPYPSRDAASGVRDRLKSQGQNGIVAPAH